MPLAPKHLAILDAISNGHPYDQMIRDGLAGSYFDIFRAAEAAIEELNAKATDAQTRNEQRSLGSAGTMSTARRRRDGRSPPAARTCASRGYSRFEAIPSARRGSSGRHSLRRSFGGGSLLDLGLASRSAKLCHHTYGGVLP